MILRHWIISLVLIIGIGLIWLLDLDKITTIWVKTWQNQELAFWLGKIAYWIGLGEVQAVIIAIMALWDRFNKRRNLWNMGFVIIGGLVITGLSVQLIKHLIGRPRPRMALPVSVFLGPTFQNDFHSFPSGHAATSFVIAVLFAKRWPTQSWLLYLIASLVCIGRVISGSHYLSDILGGSLLGLTIGWFLSRCLINYKKKY